MSEDIGIQIGTANYSGGLRRTFKLVEDKPNKYRILPPLGEAANRGVWATSVAVHWGSKGTNGRMKPYACIQEGRKDKDGNFVVTKHCPRCDKTNKIEAQFKKKEGELTAAGLSKEMVATKLKKISEYLRQYNRQFRYYMNALNENSEVGRLDISARHFGMLKKEIEDLLGKGIDATAPAQGVYFDFYYKGKDGHSVKPVFELGQAPGQMSLKMGPLTPNILRNLKSSYHDLLDLFPKLSEADIQRLVDNEENPEVVDAVFSTGKETKVDAVPETVAASQSLEDV